MATPRKYADETDGTNDSKGNWIAVALTGVVAIAVGLAGGFVIGDRRGKSTNKNELADARAVAEANSESARIAELKIEQITNENLHELKKLESKIDEREKGIESIKKELAETKAKIPSEPKKPTTANELVALIKNVANGLVTNLPENEKTVFQSYLASLDAAIASRSNIIPRPEKIFAKNIGPGDNQIGQKGVFAGVAFLETIINDNSAILKVGYAIPNGTARADLLEVRYYAQNFKTSGLVDSTPIAGKSSFIIVGTRTIKLANGSQKTIYVVEPE